MLSEPVVRYSVIAVVAALIAFVATPVTLMAARRLRLTDQPGPRKFHLAPVPVLGGLAIWAAVVGSLLLFGGGREFRELAAIVAGGTLIALVGLVDDRVGLGPRGKLIGQVTAMLLISLAGVKINLFAEVWLNVAVTVFWGVFVINAINLQDNMDGLAAGISAVAAGAFLLLAMLNGQVLVASLAAALLGACLGFLFYNFQPAVSFMGDTGSMLLGIALAVLGIKLTFPGVSHSQTWLVPVFVLGVPAFDTLLVVVSRVRRGKPWWQGGIDHTSHRMVQLGLSHRRTAIALYLATGILGLLAAVMVYLATPTVAWMLTGGTLLLGLGLIYGMELLWEGMRESRLKADINITAIGGGEEFLPVLQAVATVGKSVAVVLTPVAAEGESATGLREVDRQRMAEFATVIAEHPGSVRRMLKAMGEWDAVNLRERAALMNAAFRLRGQLLANLSAAAGDDRSAAASPEVLRAIRETDLIVVSGDLSENVMPTLALSEVSRALTRAKCPRVLVHADPGQALERLASAGVADVFTHAIAPQQLRGPWHAVEDLRDSGQLALALHGIWLKRTRRRSLLQPLGVGLHG
jgi:UDP-GlcNAc:undecaprenyl-phosphate GlcNAc-1-phosphate transferase